MTVVNQCVIIKIFFAFDPSNQTVVMISIAKNKDVGIKNKTKLSFNLNRSNEVRA